MAEPFIGEIRMFAGNYAPPNWALCDGSILSVTDNQALFSLLGALYGGDGHTTFALPNLRGRLPVGTGTGNGLTPRQQGETFGLERVTLTQDQLPEHQHAFMASTDPATGPDPSGQTLADTAPNLLYEEISGDEQNTPLREDALQPAGNDHAHSNMMPTLAISFIIALRGIYPPRH